MSSAPNPEVELRSRFHELATDLLSLEVNTLLKESILATKMPSAPHALLDIIGEYDFKLKEMGDKEPLWAAQEGAEKVASWEYFHKLRERAKALEGSVSGSSRLMLARIIDSADQIKGIFEKVQKRGVQKEPFVFTRRNAEGQAFPMMPDERMLLRKIWEVGTEEVMMQTVIHLDGDIITRLQPRCLEPGQQSLLRIHHEAVQSSANFWGKLVEIIGRFIGGITQMFPRV